MYKCKLHEIIWKSASIKYWGRIQLRIIPIVVRKLRTRCLQCAGYVHRMEEMSAFFTSTSKWYQKKRRPETRWSPQLSKNSEKPWNMELSYRSIGKFCFPWENYCSSLENVRWRSYILRGSTIFLGLHIRILFHMDSLWPKTWIHWPFVVRKWITPISSKSQQILTFEISVQYQNEFLLTSYLPSQLLSYKKSCKLCKKYVHLCCFETSSKCWYFNCYKHDDDNGLNDCVSMLL